jgi:hypothetical protein
MNNAISRHNIVLRKNNGYIFWLNSLAIIRPNYMNARGGIFDNCNSGLRSQPSQAKIHVLSKKKYGVPEMYSLRLHIIRFRLYIYSLFFLNMIMCRMTAISIYIYMHLLLNRGLG